MKKILILLIITALFLGCSQNKLERGLSVEKKMQIADDYFAKEKYRKAILYYEDITYERNSPLVAEAQMKLAECYFIQEKFLEARLEFQEVIRLYKNYEHINEAYFKKGICFFENSLDPQYTQEETELAIDAFNEFIQKFPFDDRVSEAYEYLEKANYKLLTKKYFNGYAYYKMYDYSAALFYFDQIVDLNLKDDLDLKSLYYSAKIYIYREDKLNADIIFSKMLRRYPQDELTKKIKKEVDKL